MSAGGDIIKITNHSTNIYFSYTNAQAQCMT